MSDTEIRTLRNAGVELLNRAEAAEARCKRLKDAAEQMRERAAKAVELFVPNIRTHSDEQAIRQQFRHQAATVIRALPLDD